MKLKDILKEAPDKSKIKWVDDNPLSGFSVKKNKNAKKPDLIHLQWMADMKLKRMGTPHPVYGRTSKYIDSEAKKLLKIYDDANALINYFTNK